MAKQDSDGSEPLDPATRLVTGGRPLKWTSAPETKGHVVNPPVWRASTHLYDNVAALEAGWKCNADGDFYYGRRGGPTQWALSQALTDLEPGADATALFPSGVAAIHAALLAVLSPGDELLMTDNAYGPSRAFADGFLKKWGVTTRYFDPMVSGAEIDALFGEATRAILLESPGSLTFEVQDVPALCAAAKRRGIVSLLDNTWATSLFFPAIEKGVDITIVAGTKYIGGHSDLMLGSVTSVPEYSGAIRNMAQTLGQVISPDDAALGLRGLRTLDARLRVHQDNALAIADWLAGRPEVARLLHPAFASCPGHALWKRDFLGASGLFAIELNGDRAARTRFVDALSLFGIGYSWGGYESLALPVDPEGVRSAVPWRGGKGALVRLHIGLENADDLKHDLERGFAAFAR